METDGQLIDGTGSVNGQVEVWMGVFEECIFYIFY
jgi:hypothetical protein